LELRHPEVRFVRIRSSFVFQRAAAAEQRRIFAGPFVPGFLLRPKLVPVLPLPRGLHLQAVHASDLAEAYRLALLEPVTGAFNIAAEPVLDSAALAALLGARPVDVSPRLARTALAAAWHARLAPTEPGLLELALSLPLMATDRARTELHWRPRIGADAAVAELLDGVRNATGGPTPTLDRHAGGPLRVGEIVTGVGGRA
jgi:nucleoside-diphosphate-sugar epimerase